jgi:hypothetical protein
MPTNLCSHMTNRRLWQFCYWSMVTLLFAWAAWQRFTLPLDPIADPGTWGYLSPALRKLVGGEFGHTYGRNFIYPGFLYVLLRVFRDLRAITIAQHLLGLLAGGMLLLTWRRIRVFVAHPLLGGGGYYAMGLFAAAIFLLASEPMYFEMQLRPEGIAALLIGFNMYFAVQFAACFLVEDRRVASIPYGIATVLSSILLASAKPSFWLASIVVLLPVVMFFFQRGLFWQKIALGGCAAASAALLLLPEHFLSRNDEESQRLLPRVLFAIHADLIRDQMAADLRQGAKVPYPREWLGRVHGALSAEIEKSIVANHYRTLGFDPDYLMYHKNSIEAQLGREFGGNVSALCAFYWFYYGRIWRQRPVLVLRKITRQMRNFYAPVCPVYRQTKFLPLTNEYDRGATSLDKEPYRKIWIAYLPAAYFMDRTRLLAVSAPVVQQRAYIRKPLYVLAVTYLPLLLIAFSLSAGVLFQRKWRKHLRWLAALVLLAYLYNAAACLEVAVLHELDDRRYVTVQMFPTLLAQFFALWFVLEFALEMRAHAKSSCSDTGATYRSGPDVRCG